MRIYYGAETKTWKPMYATVTGQMDNGVLVYTEIQMNSDGSIATENGEPVLILDNQYTRHLKHGTQTFEKI